MRPEFLLNFCAVIEDTALSQLIQKTDWLIPAVQTVHIMAIAALLISALTIHLRVIQVSFTNQSLGMTIAIFFRVLQWSVLVLLFTGIVMIIGEPARSLANSAFQIKIVLLSIAMSATLYLVTQIKNTLIYVEGTKAATGAFRWVSTVAIISWISVVFSGRWIAYT